MGCGGSSFDSTPDTGKSAFVSCKLQGELDELVYMADRNQDGLSLRLADRPNHATYCEQTLIRTLQV